jgi:hypothetical protein
MATKEGLPLEDKPIRLAQLSAEDQLRIYARYPELRKLS